MKKKINLLIPILLFCVLFSAFANILLSTNLWDYDFWWHISTGRYIVETGSLPDKDPFSFASNLDENKNLYPRWENFVLKQYWLSQVLFYLVYSWAGPPGMIILRTVLLLTAIAIVLWQLKRWNVNFLVAFVYVFFASIALLEFSGERPVLFTILFTPLVFVMLEDIKCRKGNLIFLLPPLMVLWANIHGGFIIGNIMIMVYMVIEGLKIVLKKADYSGKQIRIFYGATVLALAVSFINPAGWDALIISFSPKYAHIRKGIQEYASPFFLYINKLQPVNIGYAALALLFPVVLIIRNKKIDLTHVVLLTGLFVMAAKSSRFIAFYVPIAAMVIGKESNILLQDLFRNRGMEKTHKKIVNVFNGVALLSITIYFLGYGNFKGFDFDVARKSTVPVRAVDFIEENRLPGNILNTPAFGGYITWRLYPWKKTFTDNRWLNSQVTTEYKWIIGAVESVYNKELPEGKQPLWKRLLYHYNIHLIMLGLADSYGSASYLLLELTEDREWTLIYSDYAGVIFLRNSPEYKDIIKKFEQPKENVYNAIIARSSQMVLYGNNPIYLITLGRTFYKMGRLENALKAYKYALKRMPGNEFIKGQIKTIETERQEQPN